MTLSLRRHFPLVLVALALGALVQAQQPTADLSTTDLQGAWGQVDGEAVLSVKGDQLLQLEQGTLSILGIVRRRQDVLIVRNVGELETWHASLKEGVLHFGRRELRAYRRLKDVPPGVELHAVTFAAPHPLPPARVEEIQQEIGSRFKREQEVLKDPAQALKAPGLREENLRYLTRLAQEVGWPDRARFGERTSVDATILLKHTGDLPLTMAALPFVERDLKLTGDGQTYAVLYDGLQLKLGKKQRYGTQIGEDSQGNPYVLPLENPAKVDDYLKALSLPPLSSYMADISKYLYNGKPVRLAKPEESD